MKAYQKLFRIAKIALIPLCLFISCLNPGKEDGGNTKVNNYMILFELQGGTGINRLIFAKQNSSIDLPSPYYASHQPYTFNGWFSEPSGGTKYESPYTVLDSVTMYAQWTPDDMTISFDAQDGDSISPIETKYGYTITLPAATREGYVFDGWYNSWYNTGSRKCGESGDSYIVIFNPSSSTACNVISTMYARWTKAYTVTFDSQNGGSVSSIIVGDGSKITLPTPPARDGCNFGGWINTSDGGTRYGDSGDVYTVKSDITMYALWTKTYTVTFDSRGGEMPGYTNPYPYFISPDSNSRTITLLIPTRTGYVFNGWFSEAMGGTELGYYSDNYYGVNTYYFDLTHDTTMYAQWTEGYTVKFDLQGGSGSPQRTVLKNSEITLPASNRNGYIFTGWFDAESGGTKIGGSGDVYTVAADITMYAQWTINCTVRFYSRDTFFLSQTVFQNTEITLPAPARDGYTFDGWYSSSSGGKKFGGGGDLYTVTDSVIMYAQWLTNYTVTFDSWGGESVPPVTAAYITLPTPTHEGYTLDGWYSASGGTILTKIGNGGDLYTVTGNIKIYAQWTANNYTITFDSQDGEKVSPITAAYDSYISLPTPTRSGYTFYGWFSAESGGTKYESPYTINGNVTMYAQWKQLFTITFVDSYSDFSPITAADGSDVTLPTPTRSGCGYQFDGWYSSISDGTKYESPHAINGDVTMFAQWTWKECFTITFDSRDDSSVSPITARSGSYVTLPTLTRRGYTFSGWYNLYDDRYDDPYMISGDVYMYARWTQAPPSTCIVTFFYNGKTVSDPWIGNCGATMRLPNPGSLPGGAIFDRWHGGGGSYSGGSNYTVPGNVTMTATEKRY